jgi:hypothetical protein
MAGVIWSHRPAKTMGAAQRRAFSGPAPFGAWICFALLVNELT